MATAPKIKTAAKVAPQIYAYQTPDVPKHDGWTKIGYTERDVDTRIHEQSNTIDVDYVVRWHRLAKFTTEPYDSFDDKAFHKYLTREGVERKKGKEWFHIDPDHALNYFKDFQENHGEVSTSVPSDAVIPYTLRSEQAEAVDKAKNYFAAHKDGQFLWNCKPRFGKTLSAYDLCKKMGAKSVLIVTNRPAIANSWYSDYETFLGPQSGYVFVSVVDSIKDKKYVFSRDEYVQKAIKSDDDLGCIEFVSLQNLKRSIYFGGIEEKLDEVANTEWDILIIDEAHEGVDTYKTDVAFDQIKRKATLHLSGTPFKALANDKFDDDAIYNWTYADEQRKKLEWNGDVTDGNPYATLPKLNMFTYQMSEIVKNKAMAGIELADRDVEEYAFDLNEFFKTNEAGTKFVHDEDVDKFLVALTTQEKFPFSTPELRDELKHTFWLLNRVSSAKCLAKKLKENEIFKDYEIVLAAGDGKLDEDDENIKAYDKVKEAIDNYDKTITLSVGQLTTGVTIPEWTAVLMLSNMKSPALYMQAAFRAQNPCLFHDANGDSYRKENAYVFDFDPARTLDIFEKFAVDLSPDTAAGKGDVEHRKKHIRELLNYFPVYGEDDEGSMIELDAEKVMTIPRHIHAREVVSRGFMSNFLFTNISNIFGAPKEVQEQINNWEAIEEPAPKKVDAGEDIKEDLDINDYGDVDIPDEEVIGTAKDVFGKKIYKDVSDNLDESISQLTKTQNTKEDSEKKELKDLQETFGKPISDTLVNTAKEHYGRELKKSTQKKLDHQLRNTTDHIVAQTYSSWKIADNQKAYEAKLAVDNAKKNGATIADIADLNSQFDEERQKMKGEMLENINKQVHSKELIDKAAQTVVKIVETEKKNALKVEIESSVRDHLRGFTRTIPSFLMAYGDQETRLENFDKIVPPDVFEEVTGTSIEWFRRLRDGYDYQEEDENGNELPGEEHRKHFEGHLFDNVVFNDSCAEFLKKKEKLANWFNDNHREDIFDYIPPQKTNQIFTPKKVVKDMVDMLEEENPNCFDDANATFADLYVKSGLYITEIVKRLMASSEMKRLYPVEHDRLKHIFEKQVYGLAPTEIIYRIAHEYIFGFDKTGDISDKHFKQFDSLPLAKDGTLAEKLDEIFTD
ncbi:DEAD/DEAH box helicase family protein [Lactobacillus delbrueckii subsp. bulgaricus]|nr:restriction endonuclease [Lactobacillus delbrueckii subsp. bulgaricus]MBT9027261.1 restriction endonuclease [Lactobacillus delbrueckii subsp. bulgaricus]MBT9039913.1 restriction endonuclease [Lactobacillus delbrueckii subsp. bulgaricus]MBT9087664.1 restriction endonuclease [Lactobacillus delbrueckii subsp. bulgaricus]